MTDDTTRMCIVDRLRGSLKAVDPYLLRSADIAEAANEIERLLAVPRAQTERERHEALERARKEGWDAAIADRALTMPPFCSSESWGRSLDHLLYGPEFMAKGKDWETTEIIRRKLVLHDG